MSMPAMTLARKCKTKNPPAKAVLMALADFADENWQCWPSQQQLMEYTELGERTVRKALDHLESLALIARQERRTAHGTRRSDLITLSLEQPACGAGSGEQPASGAGINRHVVPEPPARGAGILIGTLNRTLSRKGAGAREDHPEPSHEPTRPLSDDQLRAKLVAQLPDGCTWPVRNAPNVQDIRRAMDLGADLERHVLPAIRSEAQIAHQGGRSIATWAAFTTATLARMERERIASSPATIGGMGLSDDCWRREVAYWQRTGGHWSHNNISEPPDSPRTAVPKHILAEFGYGAAAA